MRHCWSLRRVWSPLLMVLFALLAMPAWAQQDAVHWHKDLESAKVVAKESGRLVLVHFWAPSCGPCMALNQTVFNQPGVANAIETQFVPVKLNADENSATASWYGITRIPCDVIVTPDGQMVAKLISPPTPAAYVAEVTAAAGKYTAKSGQTFAKAAAAAPVVSGLNPAYASLQVSPSVPLAVSPTQPQQVPATLAAMSSTNGQPTKALNASSQPFTAAAPVAPAAPIAPPVAAQSAAPLTVNNPAAYPPVTQAAQTPAAAAPPIQAAPSAPPQQVNNPYAGLTAAAAPAQAPPQAPTLTQQQSFPAQVTPAQTLPIGYDRPQAQTAAVNPAAVPPGYPAVAAAVSPAGPPVANAAPDPRQLPPGSAPLGFDGYCPVSMRNSWRWVAGDPRYGVVHRGHTYWFATAEEQKQFWTDPDRYTPALSGIDPVLAIDHKQQVPGKREHSLDYDGLFYMFASEATLQQFTANPQKYSTGVRQAMGIPRGRLVR